MDPSYVSTPIWHGLSITLRLMLVLVGCAFLFAGNMVIAHMVIPSLVTTGHISERFSKLRALFYMGALAGVVGLITTFVVIADVIRVVGDMYPRWWI